MATSISLCLWVFLLYCLSSVIQGERAMDCCLRVSYEEIPKHIVKRYTHQTRGYGCDISAVIFTTKRNRNLCAPPGVSWVADVISYLDKELKRCKERSFKGQRCKSLRA
ncbi:C-C motif chemokine 19-like [Megalops cyprinoides]|uniref:C-C motif chemokine 19-like n=1 Tax=Megalops cyprinoides TaxID=118141 RepID=UPI001864B7CE|nr:C-C motif chemokine 19-like [Megalops cyprinoides]